MLLENEPGMEEVSHLFFIKVERTDAMEQSWYFALQNQAPRNKSKFLTLSSDFLWLTKNVSANGVRKIVI